MSATSQVLLLPSTPTLSNLLVSLDFHNINFTGQCKCRSKSIPHGIFVILRAINRYY